MSIDITRIEIKIPQKGSVFLVEKDFEDAFEGDEEAIKFLHLLFKQAVKNGVTYSYADHADIVTKKVTLDDVFNCDAIRDVLAHNGIEVGEDFPTYALRFTELNALYGIDVIF